MLIILFTKDRPDRVVQTIPQWKNSPFPVVVLDDSIEKNNRELNRKYAESFGLAYHGPLEQSQMLSKLSDERIPLFSGYLGQNNWNLGNNRNYALILATAMGYRTIILSDDDVLLKNTNILFSVRDNLKTDNFIGANITGMHDDSIVGHLYYQSGKLLQPQYVSGTFVGININAVRFPFLNIYNEDWIWLCMENEAHVIKKNNDVIQLPYLPFKDWENKIIFQEEGEIFWEGIYMAYSHKDISQLTSQLFWKNIIQQRIPKIKALSSLKIEPQNNIFVEEIQYVLLKYLNEQNGLHFAKIYNEFNKSLSDWQQIVVALKTINKNGYT